MTKWEKLIDRARKKDKSLTFEELAKILSYYGYIGKRPSSGSSHCTFRKIGKPPITLPDHMPMGVVYIDMVRHVIEEEESI